MGILDRLNRVIRANLNEMLDKAEDPVKMLDQHLEDMREGVRQAESQVLEALTQKKRLEQQRQDLLEKVRSWEDRAMRAVQRGDDDLAREALRHKQDADDLLAEAEVQIETQEEYARTLKLQLQALKEKMEDAYQKRPKLVAQYRVREKRRRLEEERRPRPIDPDLLRQPQASEAFSEYERMAGKIDNLEVEMEAQREIDELLDEGKVRDEEWEEKFRRLEQEAEQGGTLEDELAALKRKLSS